MNDGAVGLIYWARGWRWLWNDKFGLRAIITSLGPEIYLSLASIYTTTRLPGWMVVRYARVVMTT